MLNLTSNNLFAGRYRLKKRLGQGGFSEVWLAYNEQARIDQVLKVYTTLDDHGTEIFRREFARVYNLIQRNLLRATSFDVHEGYPYLVMPYCAKGSVSDLAGNMSEKDLAQVMSDIGAALAFIHDPSRHIIHKDIKPDNILVNDAGEYMLGDFGISSELRRQLIDQLERQGSSAPSDAGIAPMAYRAPEYFEQNGGPLIASDIWAFGASLYELATGQLPFGELGGTLQSTGVPIPDLPSNYTRSFNLIVKKCLSPTPWERPSAKELHEWAKDYCSLGYWNINILPPRKSSYPKMPGKTALVLSLSLAGILIAGGIGFNEGWFSKDTPPEVAKVEDPPKNEPIVKEQPLKPSENRKTKKDDSTGISKDPGSPEPKITHHPADESRPPSQVYLSPHIMSQPSDKNPGLDSIMITEVRTNQNDTRITMYIQGSGTINLFGPGSEQAFFIRADGVDYGLKRLEGCEAFGEEIDASSGLTLELFFDPLPRDVRSFDLLEGKTTVENRRHWNFRGIQLTEPVDEQ
jgi:serine/threonine protein kinase